MMRQDKNAFGKIYCSVLTAFTIFMIEKVRSLSEIVYYWIQGGPSS